LTPPGVQDHLGFRIFEWYLEICRQELGRALPIVLPAAGYLLPVHQSEELQDSEIAVHAQRNIEIFRLLTDDFPTDQQSLPSALLACNFWLLAADEQDPSVSQAWFQPDGRVLPVVDALKRMAAASARENLEADGNARPAAAHSQAKPRQDDRAESLQPQAADGELETSSPISHYVLLPLYGWGAAEWDLRIIQPLLQKSHPTIGFSLEEARLASRVTVVGSLQVFPEELLESLRAAGCQVDRILEDGTVLAP
jgi:hypothetical protein